MSATAPTRSRSRGAILDGRLVSSSSRNANWVGRDLLGISTDADQQRGGRTGVLSRAVPTGFPPATLGAMLDLAMMFELLIEHRESRALAILLRSEGLRLIDDLNGLIGLDAKI
jgi:hypothetical protein